MFVLQFKTFVDELQLEVIGPDEVQDEPILIVFTEKKDVSQHEILRRFRNLLSKKGISWVRPLKELTNEWVFDLRSLRASFPALRNAEYLKGKITLEPEYAPRVQYHEFTDEVKSVESSIKFLILPQEVYQYSSPSTSGFEESLLLPMRGFQKDHAEPHTCGFLMMKYEDSEMQKKLTSILKALFSEKGYSILRADEKSYSDEVLPNIKTYMHGCAFGVALFERINNEYFNPNVSLEIGYMMALQKPILYLKDSTLRSLHTDLVGKLYSEFDFQNPEPTLRIAVQRWLADRQ